jgi:hypothetical protein
VWNVRTMQCTHRFRLMNTRVYSLCTVDLFGRTTIWVGCDDEVRVFSSSRALQMVLPLPHGGEATALATTGFGMVWAGVRNPGAKDSRKGSLYVWNFG